MDAAVKLNFYNVKVDSWTKKIFNNITNGGNIWYVDREMYGV